MRIALALAALFVLNSFGDPAAAQITNAPKKTSETAFKMETVAKGLAHPWGLAFLPDGRLLVTERSGRMRLVARDGRSEQVKGVPRLPSGQGGLLDVVLSPDFGSTGLIFFSYSEPRGGGKNNTALARAKLTLGEDARPAGGRQGDLPSGAILCVQPSFRLSHCLHAGRLAVSHYG